MWYTCDTALSQSRNGVARARAHDGHVKIIHSRKLATGPSSSPNTGSNARLLNGIYGITRIKRFKPLRTFLWTVFEGWVSTAGRERLTPQLTRPGRSRGTQHNRTVARTVVASVALAVALTFTTHRDQGTETGETLYTQAQCLTLGRPQADQWGRWQGPQISTINLHKSQNPSCTIHVSLSVPRSVPVRRVLKSQNAKGKTLDRDGDERDRTWLRRHGARCVDGGILL